MIPSQELESTGLPGATGPGPRRQIDSGRSPSPLTSVAGVLQNLVEEARSILGAHHAAIRITFDEGCPQILSATSSSTQYETWNDADTAGEGFGLGSFLYPISRPMRMTHAELLAHPAWKAFGKIAKNRPPLHSWLAVPLLNRQRRNFGLLELADKCEGEFSAEDELQLVHLANIASLAVENAWLYQTAEEARSAVPRQPYSLVTLQTEIGKILLKGNSLRDTLQECADSLAQDFQVACARIWVKDGSTLELHASGGLAMPMHAATARIPIGQTRIGRIAQTRRPLLTNTLLDDPETHDKDWVRHEGLTSMAACPLAIDDDVEGVLVLFDRKPMTSPVVDALLALAHDLTLAIRRQHAGYTPLLADAPTESAERATGHAVITTTLDGVITDWNAGAAALFGYPRSEAVGLHLRRLTPDDRAAEHQEIMATVTRGETIAKPDTALLHHSGRHLEISLTGSALRDMTGTVRGAILVAHDLAEQKRLQQQYRMAQKMEVFGQLAGGVAHDFNNLLTVILGYSEILMTRQGPSDPTRELLSEIHKAGQRAETLTRQLLAFSRKQVVEPKVLDLNAIVSDTEKMLRRLIGEDIVMTTIFAPTLKPVKVDPGQMQQVVLNLAVNARDAMPKGGRLTIETDNVRLDEAYAQSHPHVRAGDYVMLALSDTGIGMSAAVKARLFEPLFTTKSMGKGTGLGLATVKSIVKQCGGHIEVYSEVGLGSTFKVYLPQVHDPLSTPQSRSGLNAIPRGTETVLLVEDENSVRALARRVLEICGYTVLEAINGEEASRVAEGYTGPIDLLVSDVVMPYLGGRQLADRLLALRPQLKILFLSGYTNDAVVRHGVLEADFPFLQKPFTTSALAQKVRDVLNLPAARP